MSIEARKTASGKNLYIARVKSGRELVATKAFDTKRAAETWEREQKHRLETGRPLPPSSSFRLDDLVQMFLAAREEGNPHTVATDRNNVAALSKALLVRPLASIHADDIRNHLLVQLRKGKAPATVARAKTSISAMFTYADEQGLLHQPHPVRTMKRIPELSAPALRAISPKDVPSPPRLVVAIASVREKRPDIADVFEFMSLTGIRWGEVRAMRVSWLSAVPFPQLVVESSHSDNYDEKVPKSWRGTRAVPLSPRAVEIFGHHSSGKERDDYVFTNTLGGQFKAGVVRKFPLGFHRHALRHYAASTWLRLGTPVHEVAEYLGDDPRTVLAIYAHILGEGQRRAHVARLADDEAKPENQAGDTWGTPGTQYG